MACGRRSARGMTWSRAASGSRRSSASTRRFRAGHRARTSGRNHPDHRLLSFSQSTDRIVVPKLLEAGEVAIGAAKDEAVLDRQRGEMRVGHEVPGARGVADEAPEDLAMPLRLE